MSLIMIDALTQNKHMFNVEESDIKNDRWQTCKQVIKFLCLAS